MRFDLTDLNLLVACIETGSLTQGAQRTHIALAAASARISLMERRLNVQLLERSRKGVVPTPAGEAMLKHARIILGNVGALEADVAEFAGGLRGRVRLLSNTNALTEFLPQALGCFLAGHRDISVTVEERLSHDIVRAVTEGEADIGIVAGTADIAGLQSYRFASDRLALVVPTASHLGPEALAFETILSEDFVGLQETSAIQAFVAGLAERAGRPIKLRMQMLGFDAVCRMVENGAGIAIVPESSAHRAQKSMDVRIVPLIDPWARRDLRLCVREVCQLTPVAFTLFEHLREYGESGAESECESSASSDQ
ncbi:LysR family transcriptional regulator [Beijerinckia indica]|uniref:Transcriptional regulator, LysR family n=1 Tax=Beijerinckia indica subsp. indica (strain ATCC 9039 / DSM 1715 / NCIMB 8712) TaxID=395963 RepID=B2IIS7_BEII9|nr:LysR family transcriptional regulator [Beijerinckia indica]ACB96139.1 transcriptional regulator, LysR family [Beijerinckia indica subsp. indica ATCC 9039]